MVGFGPVGSLAPGQLPRRPEAIVESVGASAGDAIATGVGSSTFSAVGASTGIATATGVATGTFSAVGASAGSSSTLGIGTAVTDMIGSSVGSSAVGGIATAVTDMIGSANGSCFVVGTTSTLYGDTEIICAPAELRAMSLEEEDRALIATGDGRGMEVLLEVRALAAGPRQRIY